MGKVQTLVVLMGNIRGGPLTWRSIRHNLVAPLNAHLAILTAYNTSTAFLEEHFAPQHIWLLPEYETQSPSPSHGLTPSPWPVQT